MKRRTVSILLATALLVSGMGNLPSVNVRADDGDTVNIAVDEDFSNINILTMTEYSETAEWIFNMTYDTLLTQSADGTIGLGLVEECVILSTPDGGGDEEGDDESTEPSHGFDWSAWPASWGDYPPGWKNVEDINFDPMTAELSFLDGPGPFVMEFRLREDLFFSDGTRLTAYDVYNLIEYARFAPSNSLIHKQWSLFYNVEDDPEEPLQRVIVIDEQTFQFRPNFLGGNFGWIDFLYGLTSPMASIVQISDLDDLENMEFILGTGAYCVWSTSETEVNLFPNDYWALGEVPTQNVKFLYIDDEEDRGSAIADGVADIAVIPPNSYEPYMVGIDTVAIAGNPLYLIIQKERTDFFRDVNQRKAFINFIQNESDEWNSNSGIQNQLANNTINPIFNNTLAYEANGIWTKDTVEYRPEEIRTVLSLLLGSELRLLTIADPYHRRVAEMWREDLAQLEIDLEIYEAETKTELASLRKLGGYDLVLSEIEPSDMNSAYNELFDILPYNAQEMLADMRIAADRQTYLLLHSQVQSELCKDMSYVNLGWKNKLISYHAGISGITFPTDGFNPMGDVHRIDFTGVTNLL